MAERKYKEGDPGSGNLPEIINSRPIRRPAALPNFDITPHGDPVEFSTVFDNYTWPEVILDLVSEPDRIATPGMYYHDTLVELTFTANIRVDNVPRTIIEYYWDFGDGSNAVGPVVTHTYRTANPSTMVHLRVTEDDGTRAYASMNPMLIAISTLTWAEMVGDFDGSGNTWNEPA